MDNELGNRWLMSGASKLNLSRTQQLERTPVVEPRGTNYIHERQMTCPYRYLLLTGQPVFVTGSGLNPSKPWQ